jgi:tRNA pseudouridine55 synthase
MVRIDSIHIKAYGEAAADLRVVCGSGTYIRSLAHDIGERLGVGAHLTALVRESSGGFSLADARSPDELRALADAGELDTALLAVDRAVERRFAVILEAPSAHDVALGRDIGFTGGTDARICRAYSTDGAFLGMLERTASGGWHPGKMVSKG